MKARAPFPAHGSRPSFAPALLAAAASLAALLIAAAILSGVAARAASGSLSIDTDKLVYHTGDNAVFNLALDSGAASLSGDIVIRIYPAASLMNADRTSGQPLSETTLIKDFKLSGAATASAEAPLSELKVGPGGYPVKISLMSGGQEALSGTGWLAVVDPAAQAPLDLVLLWTSGSAPERDSQGRFIDTGLIDRCRAQPRRPDTLLQHLDLSRLYPKVKTTYAIEASVFDQLQSLAGGFDLVQGGNIASFAPDSAESKSASACLDGFRTLAASANTEFIAAPYYFASLPLLAKQGWSDGNGQYSRGHDILADALQLPSVPQGIYTPGLDVTTDSMRYLAATGGEYSVFSGSIRASIQGRLPAGEPSYRVRDLSGERITALFANDDASAALFSDTPDGPAFFAALANAYTSGARLTIAASPSPNPVMTEDLRRRIYSTVEQEPWLQSLTLGEARQKYRPSTQPVTLMRYIDPTTSYVTGTYYTKLDAAHEGFEDFRAAVDSDVPEYMNLEKQMYAAESTYFVNENVTPDAANQGLAYLDAINSFTAGQFENLSIDVSTPLLQRDANGEATVTMVNRNPYALTMDLSLSGNGVDFPEGPDQRLRLEPGRVQIKVPFSSGGWSNLTARLSSRGDTLVEDSAGIHLITSRGWIVIIFALGALAAGIIYTYIVTRSRRRAG
ncbi:MAG: hypothetical protein ACYC6Z_08025 [Thermoleophilia bacterium]